MVRVWAILSLVELAFLVFSFIDVLLTQSWRVKALPKVVWVFIVLILSPIGGILWFLVGKEPVDTPQPQARARTRPVHPDDDPEFLASVSARDHEDEVIRRLEQELADLDDDKPEK